MTEDKQFRLWAMGCSHLGTDLRRGPRESLADAFRHSQQGGDLGGPPFEWDIAFHLGDLSGSQTSPDDDEGREVVRQFAALEATLARLQMQQNFITSQLSTLGGFGLGKTG